MSEMETAARRAVVAFLTASNEHDRQCAAAIYQMLIGEPRPAAPVRVVVGTTEGSAFVGTVEQMVPTGEMLVRCADNATRVVRDGSVAWRYLPMVTGDRLAVRRVAEGPEGPVFYGTVTMCGGEEGVAASVEDLALSAGEVVIL